MAPPPAEVDALIERGDYHAAARLLADAGQLAEAQLLLEKVWDFAAAADMARSRGERVATWRLLLEARDPIAADQVLSEILAGGDAAELTPAASVAERRSMWREAALLLERAGEAEAARERFVRAGLLLEAGRIDERLGRLREAGLLYEEMLAGLPDEKEAARARLGLGRVLSLLGRHEDAVRGLQWAIHSGRLDEPNRDEADRLLVVSLAALGLLDGARHVLGRLRERRPETPALDAFLRQAARERGGGVLLAGHYRILLLLGAGAMGRVYLAHDRVTDEDVAVKVVPPPVEPRAREGYRRFLREARAMASVVHPNIVAAREVLEAEGLLVMEYLPGGTLEARSTIDGRPQATRLGVGPTAGARKLLLEVVAGLTAAHAQGIVHRDVKPANIFFSHSGEAKLGDFGAAHLSSLEATRTAGFVGTLAYLAPEQITAAPLSFACDVYALGVTAFQLLTGRLPFEGPDFVGQHLGQPAPAPSSRVPGAPAAVWEPWDRLVMQMMEKAPSARPESLAALTRALEALPVQGSVAPSTAVAPPVPAPLPTPLESVRYRVEADVGGTAISTLHHGVDAALSRPVTLERFKREGLRGAVGEAHLARLRRFARDGGPHLQRVLHLDVEGRVAVYELVQGTRAIDLPRPLARATAGRLILDVLTALSGPHTAGAAHGALLPAVVMEPSGATVVIAGTLAPPDATPQRDLDALRDFVAASADLDDLPVTATAAALAAWARAAVA